MMDRLIEEGVNNKGFSVVEALTYCPVGFGRSNKLGDAPKMLNWYKEHAVPIEKAGEFSIDELQDKITIGIHYRGEAPEFVEDYNRRVSVVLK